ncbi:MULTISPECIES: type 4a pilus biogenesis protein PilO [unclassified Clostridium]|uniref:type 4a pilus biogenesis protein PilO n=1 Tax=unclassified Clostridium TaxID=2614128 RepID=UPI003216BDBD
MKVSKREKFLLGVLVLIIICTAYYKLVYERQYAKLQEIKQEESELNKKYNEMLSNINTITKNKGDIKILKGSIGSKSMLLYPKIYQDRIIIELNKLLNNAGIKGSLTFSEVTVSPIEAYFSEVADPKEQASLEQVVEESSKEKTKEDVEEKLEETKELGEDQATKRDEGESTGNKVEQMKVSVSFNGTYKNVAKFVKLISEYERILAMPNINITASGNDEVSGTLDLEFYSIPKINPYEDSKYLKWTFDEEYGKENPFLEGNQSSMASRTSEGNNYVLIMALKGVNSDLPSLTLGKENDLTRESYIYNDENKKVDVEIEVNKEGGKYYIKYKTEKSSYPSDYSKNGIELRNVDEENINIAIYSSKRIGIDDKVGANIKVINNANDKKVSLTIIDDDKTSPRVQITPEGKVEYVNK